MDKVIGGTVKGGSESICKSCRGAQIIYGVNNQEVVFCRKLEKRMGFPVTSCSIYDDKRLPDLYDMKDTAWIVRSRNRGPMGFAGEEKREIVVEPPNRDRENQPATASPSGEGRQS